MVSLSRSTCRDPLASKKGPHFPLSQDRPLHLPVLSAISRTRLERQQGGCGRGAGEKGRGCGGQGVTGSAPFPTQAPEPELGEQYEAVCDSTYSEAESAAAEVLDLPLPSYFRSRSHSYLRAIQAGCSQEEDTGSVRSISPPPAGSLSGSRTLPTNSSECGGARREGKGRKAHGDGGCCCQPPGRC